MLIEVIAVLPFLVVIRPLSKNGTTGLLKTKKNLLITKVVNGTCPAWID